LLILTNSLFLNAHPLPGWELLV